jgi:hypothetical protein
MGITISSARGMAEALGIEFNDGGLIAVRIQKTMQPWEKSSMRGTRWTKSECAVIRQHAGTLSADEIGELLPGRNGEGVRKQASKMRLSLYRRGEKSPKAVYSDAQIERACDLYYSGGMRLKEIEAQTGVKYHTIQAVIHGKNRRPEVPA